MTERLTFFYFLPAVWRIDGKDVWGGRGDAEAYHSQGEPGVVQGKG